MMDSGSIVLDIGGAERSGLTVADLLTRFRAGAGKALDNDRILLSEIEKLLRAWGAEPFLMGIGGRAAPLP